MRMKLNTMWLGKNQKYFDELDSTNTYLKEHALELAHGTVVIARRQTQGRGRLGRVWRQNESGKNLALSVLLHGADTEKMAAVPLATGVAVATALKKLCGINLGLKWSNDVLFEDRKLCGILCESRITADKAFAVLGIGVNLSGVRKDFELLDLVYATSLELATGKSFDFFEAAAAICNELEPVLDDFGENGFASIRERYKEYCVTLGKEVRVVCAGTERHGKALDIGADGSLICDISGETVSVNAGEASVRGIYGYA